MCWMAVFRRLHQGADIGGSTAEAGNSYFFIVRDRFVEDRGPAEKMRSPLDSDEGQLLLRSVWLQHLSPQEMN